MKAKPASRRGQRAFTLIELIVLVGIFLAAVILILPYFAKTRTHPPGIRCMMNLKNLNIAYRIFASDHNDRFPWQLNTTTPSNLPPQEEIMTYLLPITNELSTPIILYCPTDLGRQRADTWTNLTRTNVSYFISPDATDHLPTTILAGDRYLSHNNVQFAPGRAKIPLEASNNLSWTPSIHQKRGNLAMADGSVQSASNPRLREQFLRTYKDKTNHSATFLFP